MWNHYIKHIICSNDKYSMKVGMHFWHCSVKGKYKEMMHVWLTHHEFKFVSFFMRHNNTSCCNLISSVSIIPPESCAHLLKKRDFLALMNMSWTDWHWDRIDFDPDMSDLKFWIQWARSGGLNSLFKTCLHPRIYGQSFLLELLSTLSITWHICFMGHFNVKFLKKK